MISSHFFTGLYMTSIGANLVRCLLPYLMLTISKPLNFSIMQLEIFFLVSAFLLSFFLDVLNFFLSSNTLKKYPCSISTLFTSKHCPSNLWWSNLSWSFPLKPSNFTYNSAPISFWKLWHWSTFLLFRSELNNKLHKKMNL